MTIVHHGLQALDGAYGWFGSIDSANNMLVTRAFEGYPPGVMDPFMAIALEESLPATEVLRTGEPIFVESAADRVQRFPQYHGMEVHGSFVVVPLPRSTKPRAVLSFGFLEPRDSPTTIAGTSPRSSKHARRRSGVRRCSKPNRRSRARLRTLLDFSEQLAGSTTPKRSCTRPHDFAATRIGRCAIVHAREPNGHAPPGRDRARRDSLQPALQDLVDRGVGGRDLIMKAADTGLGASFGALQEVLVPAEHPNASDAEVRRAPRAAATGVRHRRRDDHRGPDAWRRAHRRRHPVPFGHADSSSRSTSGAAPRPRSNGRSSGRSSQFQLEAEHHIVEVLQESIVPERLPELAGLRAGGRLPARRRHGRRRRRLVRRVRGRRRPSSSWSATSPATASRPRASWDGFATACARTRSRTPTRPTCSGGTRVLRRLGPGRHGHRVRRVLPARHRRDDVVARRPSAAAVVRSPTARTRFLEDVNARRSARSGRTSPPAQVTLSDGSLLVCYTDGLVERRDRLIDEGLDWLAARTRASRDEPLDDLCASLVDRSFARAPPPTTSACWPCASPRPSTRRVHPRHRHRRHQARGRPRARRRRAARRAARHRLPTTTDAETLSTRSPRVVRPARRADAIAVGVGCGGPMDRGGEHVSPLNIPAWRGFPLRARLAAHFGLPVCGRQRRQGARARRRLDRARPRAPQLHRHGRVDRHRRRHRLDGRLLDGAERQRRATSATSSSSPTATSAGAAPAAASKPRHRAGDRAHHRPAARRRDARRRRPHRHAGRPRGRVGREPARPAARGRQRFGRARLRRRRSSPPRKPRSTRAAASTSPAAPASSPARSGATAR